MDSKATHNVGQDEGLRVKNEKDKQTTVMVGKYVRPKTIVVRQESRIDLYNRVRGLARRKGLSANFSKEDRQNYSIFFT